MGGEQAVVQASVPGQVGFFRHRPDLGVLPRTIALVEQRGALRVDDTHAQPCVFEPVEGSQRTADKNVNTNWCMCLVKLLGKAQEKVIDDQLSTS